MLKLQRYGFLQSRKICRKDTFLNSNSFLPLPGRESGGAKGIEIRKEGERVFKGEGVTIKDKTIPLEDAGIILNGLCDFVQGVYDLKMYHVKMQRQFLQEKGMTQEELKDIEANAPDQYALIKAEAKTWLKGQKGFMPNLPRLEKITEKPAR